MQNLSYGNEYCMQFHFHANQSHFHKNGFALRLTLKQRHKGTRKWPFKNCFISSLDIGVNGKYITADNSPVSTPKSSQKTKSKRRCEVAVCSVGIMAAMVALGADLRQCAKDLRPDLLRMSSKSDKHKSPNSKRRYEVGNSNRRSWFNSISTEDTAVNSDSTTPVASPRDLEFTGNHPPLDIGLHRGPNKRPLSTPVLLKATFYHESQPPSTYVEPNSRQRSSSTTSSVTLSPELGNKELIDLTSERRDRRSKSMDSSELDRINISNESFSSDDFSGKTVVNCNRYSQELQDLDIFKIPPPPCSPRGTSSPRPDCNSTDGAPTVKFNFPMGEVKGAARPRPRPWQDSLSPSPSSSDQSPTSEQDKLTLLDVHMEGESHDTTQPLLKSDTVRRVPTCEELEKEFGPR